MLIEIVKQGSFGIWLVLKILTYAKYAPVFRTATSFKIALVIKFQSNKKGDLRAAFFIGYIP